MKKVIYCASTFSHIKNFHIPYIKKLVEDENEVVVIAGGEQVELPYVKDAILLPITKKLFAFKNIVVAYKIRKILKKEDCDCIYVNTTLAACILRLSLIGYKNRPYVINIVHGYLFGKEAFGLKKVVYLCIEKILSKYTDSILVMNEEDLKIANENKLAREEVHFINGVGVDKTTFFHQSVQVISRQDINIQEKDKVIIFVGELSRRKNQIALIEVMRYLPSNYHLILLGDGDKWKECNDMILHYRIENRIHMLGYSDNILGYYRLSDLCVSLSLSEGLPFNIVEAMLCGIPIIASDIKGHRELLDYKYLIKDSDPQNIAKFIVAQTSKELELQVKRNLIHAEKYTLDSVFVNNYNILKGKL